eukprot:TRINITY_DN5283_c1_g1_i1.p1 TRINITY_DN5283_c1_g1~~TRINITY_DN5283_c1_g1_i1.p1  ORF type:complete len:508 (-),score=81.65 TRINITY_DN5283_c1_g1_i1:274-1797(-)
METLPHEILTHIFWYLSPSALCDVTRVCWNWKELGESKFLWKALCKNWGSQNLLPEKQRLWERKRKRGKEEDLNWKDIYANCNLLSFRGSYSNVVIQHPQPTAITSLKIFNSMIVSGGQNGTVCVWNTHEFQLINSWNAHSSPVSCIAVDITKNGTLYNVCSAGSDGKINVWKYRPLPNNTNHNNNNHIDNNNLNNFFALEEHFILTHSPISNLVSIKQLRLLDNFLFVVDSRDCISIWDISKTTIPPQVHTHLRSFPNPLYSSTIMSIRVHKMNRGLLLRIGFSILSTDQSYGGILVQALSLDDNLNIVANCGNQSQEPKHNHHHHKNGHSEGSEDECEEDDEGQGVKKVRKEIVPSSFHCHRDVSQFGKSSISCLELDNDESYGNLPSNLFTPDLGGCIVVGSKNNTVDVWSNNGPRQNGSCSAASVNTLFGHTSSISDLQFDRLKIVTASLDHSIAIWDRNHPCLKYQTLNGHQGPVLCCSFQGFLLISGSSDCTIRVWNFGKV